MRWFLRCLLVFLALAALAITSLLSWRAIRQHQIRRAMAIQSPPGIDSLEPVRLGGVAQWIHIRGNNRANPLLLMLHGGPGVPEMPFGYVNAKLEKYFTVVQWDQRGAGKSSRADIASESMTIAQLVADAEELIDALRRRFGQERLLLMGHSTGTIVATLVAQRHPEAIRAYIGISQVANLQTTQKVLYEFAMRAAVEKKNDEALRELRQIGPPPFSEAKQLQTSQKWVNEFAPDRFGAIAPARLKLLFCSPACSLRDLWGILRGAKFSFTHMWREFFDANLFERAPKIDTPVYFLQGRDDHVVTAEVAKRYFDALQAPRGKYFILFEHSGHWPQLEEPEKFRRVLVEQILEENVP